MHQYQLRLQYLRTQSRPTHRFRPATIIKPLPLHHSHFIQHSAAIQLPFLLTILRMKDRVQIIYLQWRRGRRIPWNGVISQTKSAFNLAPHDYDLLLNAMSVYLAVFTRKPFTESPPTHLEERYYERLRISVPTSVANWMRCFTTNLNHVLRLISNNSVRTKSE